MTSLFTAYAISYSHHAEWPSAQCCSLSVSGVASSSQGQVRCWWEPSILRQGVKSFHTKEWNPPAGLEKQLSQWKCFLCMHGDSSSIPRNHMNQSQAWQYALVIHALGDGNRQWPGALWPASLTYLQFSGQWKTIKNKRYMTAEKWQMSLSSGLHMHAHTCTDIHTCTLSHNTHIHTPSHKQRHAHTHCCCCLWTRPHEWKLKPCYQQVNIHLFGDPGMLRQNTGISTTTGINIFYNLYSVIIALKISGSSMTPDYLKVSLWHILHLPLWPKGRQGLWVDWIRSLMGELICLPNLPNIECSKAKKTFHYYWDRCPNGAAFNEPHGMKHEGGGKMDSEVHKGYCGAWAHRKM